MSQLKKFTYHEPTNLKEVLSLLAVEPEAILLAGGTFVINHLKKSPRAVGGVVGLGKIDDLKGIEPLKDGWRLGSMVTLAELAEHEELKSAYPALAQAALSVGTTPIRNMATIGGNVASRFYWVDLPSVLLSLSAQVCVASGGKERVVDLSETVSKGLERGCIIRHLFLPKMKKSQSYYFRHTRAMPVDIVYCALACCAEKADGRLCGVKIIVNTGVSLPLELKETQACFMGSGEAALGKHSWKSAFEKDVAGVRLSEDQRALLMADLENLFQEVIKR